MELEDPRQVVDIRHHVVLVKVSIAQDVVDGGCLSSLQHVRMLAAQVPEGSEGASLRTANQSTASLSLRASVSGRAIMSAVSTSTAHSFLGHCACSSMYVHISSLLVIRSDPCKNSAAQV